MRRFGRFGLGLAFGLCGWAVSAGAQDLVAPRVKSLPGVEVPAGIELPESGLVQVLVRIDPDGKNGVLAWQAKFGLIISARVFARSGRAEGWLWLDEFGVVQQYVQRVPWFVRLDAQIAYEWARPGRRLRIALEWINITRARDAQQIDSSDPTAPPECRFRFGAPSEPCPLTFTDAIWFPNLSFRAVF